MNYCARKIALQSFNGTNICYFLGYRCLFYIGNIAPQIFMCIELWVNWEGSHVSLEQLPIKLIWPAIESITLPPLLTITHPRALLHYPQLVGTLPRD